ncbi:phosphopantetheine attachment protein [Bacillus thuringiensis]|uniref:Phosphopantetheine attachment protein n=2 Tax=Bacillus thuringiensis TaxID=1428 RepID=A0AB36TQU0_BACTU|nr:phosphopantetheine attachment protein [Bacillus thuringiensis]PEE90438.1 phosphopantetheine attachment protein [Bacillus thuringiensis]PFM84999.1 phosphopantetheine attachment protein [Bacillus thuringiensis]PGK36031.1 phosphopantetheine attachment protein [Bacillus thuringiensis]
MTLRNFIYEKFEIVESDEDFKNDVDLFNYGFIDSLGATVLNAFIEDTFSIEITTKDVMTFPLNTINEITEFISIKIGEKK